MKPLFALLLLLLLTACGNSNKISKEQVEPEIDRMFTDWSEKWTIDHYEVHSARVTELRADNGEWKVYGKYDFFRLGKKHVSDFTATARKADKQLIVSNLCYDYKNDSRCYGEE